MTDLAAGDLYQRLAGDLAARSLGTTALPVTVSGGPPDVHGRDEHRPKEMIDVGGGATFLGDAARSRVALFV